MSNLFKHNFSLKIRRERGETENCSLASCEPSFHRQLPSIVAAAAVAIAVAIDSFSAAHLEAVEITLVT